MAKQVTTPLSFEEKSALALQQTLKENPTPIGNPYAQGKAIGTIDLSAVNLPKYTSYGTEVYGKLGFDPFKLSPTAGGKKTELDELYNISTPDSADWSRATEGMWQLAGIGFQDTFAQGLFSAKDNYLDFESVMEKYSSNRGGATELFANSYLSAGYTLGIIGGIAAEEAALAAITAASGFTAAPATAAAGASTFARGVNRIIQGLDKLSDVKAARTWLGKGVIGLGSKLNPLENTMDFFRNIDQIKDFSALKRNVIGAGALVRDARKITMAHGESKLEANLAEKEFRSSQFEKFALENEMAGLGSNLTQDQLNEIDAKAKDVYNGVYNGNFGLIYATNAITFDNMFKSMKATNFLYKDLYSVIRNKGQNLVQVDVLANTAFNKAKNFIGKLTPKSAIQFVLSSSMEGFQEVGQDWISNSMQSYYARNPQGKQLRGNFFNYLEKDLTKAALSSVVELNPDGSFKRNKKGDLIFTGEAFTAFASGALMGVFAGPVGFATGQVNNYLFGGGINKTFQYIANNAQYQKDKENLNKARAQKAQLLTNFFNDTKTFLQTISRPEYSQKELEEEIIDASMRGDKKEFNDKQHKSFLENVHRLMESNLDGKFAEHLNYMADKFSTEELQEIFLRKDITDQNAGEFRDKLKNRAKRIENIRKTYNDIQQNLRNPNKFNLRSSDNPEQDFNNYVQYVAFEQLKKEMLFNSAEIEDKALRLKDLEKEIRSETALSSTEASAFLNMESLNQQISLLEVEYKSAQELNSKNKQQVFKKLSAWKSYKEKLEAYQKKQDSTTTTVSGEIEKNKLFSSFIEVMSAYGETLSPNTDFYEPRLESLGKTFNKIWDFENLSIESKYLKQYAEILNNPTGQNNFVKARAELLKQLDANKQKYIEDALEAFDKRQVSDEMLAKLMEVGLFFDLNELDALINNGVMPSEIYDSKTDTVVPATDERYNEAVKIISNFYKKLTGKKITGNKQSKSGRKYTNDKRTITSFLRNFSIKMGQSIDLSSKKGEEFIQILLNSNHITPIDKEILTRLKDTKAKIKFVNNNQLPVMYNNGVYELDLRYADVSYKNSSFSFENLVITALVQNEVYENLKTDDDLFHSARRAMEQAKDDFVKKYPFADVDKIDAFQKVEVFLSEALNDPSFQQILAGIQDNLQPAKKSLLGTVKEVVNSITTEKFQINDLENTLLNRVMNIALKATDKTITDPISESQEKISAAEQKRRELENEKITALKKQAEALGKRWNVNVQVIANQREAAKIIAKKKGPFQQRFGEILNNLMFPPVTGIDLRKVISPEEVKLLDLIKNIYEKSESLSELIQNLKDLSVYQTNNRLVDMVEFLSENADNVVDGFEVIKNLFFQEIEEEGTAGFYDETTNTAYIVADNVRSNTMYHEIFLHPYLINLEKQNPELFRKLVADARADAEIVEYVTRIYGAEEAIGSRQFEHELVGRAFDLNVNNQLEAPNRKGLMNSIEEFAKKLLTNVMEFFGINTVNRKIFNPNTTTIQDLAEYVVKGDSSIDLGAVIEIDQELNQEVPQTAPSDNLTVSEAVEEEENEEELLNPISLDDDFDLTSEEEEFDYLTIDQASIQDLQKEIQRLDELIFEKREELKKVSSLNFVKRNKLDSEIRRLLIDKNDLNDALERKRKNIEISDSNYQENFDELGILIVDHTTPWNKINTPLKEKLAELHGKPLSSLEEGDIDEIRRKMKTNPDYIAAINENYIKQYNSRAVEKSKEKEAPNFFEKVKEKTIQTNEDIIAGIVGKNIKYLDEKEINTLADLLKSKETTADEIREFVYARAKDKILQEVLATAESTDPLTPSKEDEKKTNRKLNINRALSGKLPYGNKPTVEESSKIFNLRVSANTFRFLVTYHSELFNLPYYDFVKNVKYLLGIRKSLKIQRNVYTDTLKLLKKVKPSRYEAVAKKALLNLEKSGYAFPEVVKQINDALYDVKADFRVVQVIKSKKKRRGRFKSNYEIRNKKWSEKQKPVGRKLELTKKYEDLKDALEIADTNFLIEFSILNYLINAEISKSGLLSFFKSPNDYLGFTKGLYKFKVKDDLIDGVRNPKIGLDSIAGRISTLTDLKLDENATNYLEDFLLSYSSLSDAIEQLHYRLTKNLANNEPEYDLEEEEAIRADEEAAIREYFEFLNTPEGKAAQEEEARLYEEELNKEFEKSNEEEEKEEIQEKEESEAEKAVRIKEEIKQAKNKLNKIVDIFNWPLSYKTRTVDETNQAIGQILTMQIAKLSDFNSYAKLLLAFNIVDQAFPENLKEGLINAIKNSIEQRTINVKLGDVVGYIDLIDNVLTLLIEENGVTLFGAEVNSKFDFSQITDFTFEDLVIENPKPEVNFNEESEKIIVTSYADVFNNFAEIKSEINDLSLDQAIEQFKSEISKCK